MSRPITWRGRIGVKGFTLVFFGTMFVLIGFAVTASPPDYDPSLPHTWLPVWSRCALWATAGAAGIITGLKSLWTWKFQPVGFGLMVVPPFERSASFSYAIWAEWPTDNLPGGVPWDRVVPAVVWALMVAALMIYARLEEYGPPRITAADVEAALK